MTVYEVGKPNILNPDLFQGYLNGILENGQLTNNGKYVRLLEQIGKQVWSPPDTFRHLTAVSNATQGLYLALMSLHPKKGKEVLVPSFTFAASASVIIEAGMVPKFVDIEPNSIGQVSKSIFEHLNWNSWGVILPQLFGTVLDLDYFNNVPKDFKVVYDSAHSLGCKYHNKFVGDFGKWPHVYSLHATKFIQGFEGGLISDIGTHRLGQLRNFGYETTNSFNKEIVYFGTNAKMSEVHAAMALSNILYMEDIISHYKHVWEWYKECLPKEVQLANPAPVFGRSNYSYIVVTTDYRAKILANLPENIRPKIYFKPLHTHPYYSKFPRTNMKNTDKLAKTIMCLPTHWTIQQKDVEYICDEIKKALK